MYSARYSFQILMKLEFSRQVFEKYSNIKFNEDPSSGIRVVLCGWRDRRTDMTKLRVAFRKFANAPKNDEDVCGNCTSTGTLQKEVADPNTWKADDDDFWFV